MKTALYKYEYSNLHKEALHNSILELSQYGGKAIGGAKETECNLHDPPATKEIKLVTDWISTLFCDASYKLLQSEVKSIRDLVMEDTGNYSFISESHSDNESGWKINPDGFKIHQCWGLVYDRGGATFRHNHVPYSLTFCYYINMPKGASSLYMEGKEYQMKEGECIIIPGSADHGSENNQCEGRTVLVGNVVYHP